MASEVTLPALGESVTEGTVTRWLKQVGDSVAVDEPLLEVSTDKVDTEIPSPVAGTLLEIKANEDDTVEVGAVLGVIGEEGESAGDADETAEPEAQPKDERGVGEEGRAGGGGRRGDRRAARRRRDPGVGEGRRPAPRRSPRPRRPPAAPPAAPAAGGGTAVTLPALGESVTEGTVTRWLKKVGDEVAVDEPLLEVSTDKVDTEIPSPVAGTLLEIKAEEDETVEVGAELAIIGSGDAAPAQVAPAEEPQDRGGARGRAGARRREGRAARLAGRRGGRRPGPRGRSPRPRSRSEREARRAARGAGEACRACSRRRPPAEPSGGRDQSAYVTPLVRKMADQHGVDLGSVTGTGVGGRIRKQDVLDAAAAASRRPQPRPPPAARPPPPRSAPLLLLRPPAVRRRRCAAPPSRSRACARSSPKRMVESLQESAQLTQVMEVDVTVDRPAARGGEGRLPGPRGREADLPARSSPRPRSTRSSCTPSSTRRSTPTRAR